MIAEKFLETVDHNRNFPQILLLLIDKDGIDMNVRVAGSITFKNYIKRNWDVPAVSSFIFFEPLITNEYSNRKAKHQIESTNLIATPLNQ